MADVSKTVAILFQGTDSGASASADKITASMQRMQDTQARNAQQSAEADAKWASSAVRADLLAKAANDAAIATKKQGDEAETAGGKAEGASVGVRSMAAAMAALAGSLVVREFIEANVAVENFGKAMTVITGSSAEAGTALSYVKSISNTLGLDVTTAATAFVQLTAASHGTALEGQATRDIFESISKAMSLLGKSSSDTNGALLAVQQIISKGTVSAEELRGQLGERLPGAFQIAARAVGVTTSELGDFLKQGSLTAEEFLPKFAAELNKTFGETTHVSSYTAELNRMQNAFKELATSDIGTGFFSAITQALVDVTSKTKSTSVELILIKGVFDALVNSKSMSEWATNVSAAMDKARSAQIAAFGDINQSAAETDRLLRQAGDGAQAFSDGFADLISLDVSNEIKRISDQSKEATAVLQKMGIDPKKLKDPLLDLQDEFVKLVNIGGSSGAAIFAGFEKALNASKTIEDINLVGGALATAYTNGNLSAELFAKGVDELASKQTKVEKATGLASDSIAKQQKEFDKAKEAADKYALEMEKLASNERIKTLEFKANIDVARIQADAQKVIAAFDSINNTINSTADVIGSIFDQFKGINDLDSSARNALFKQLDIENDIRRQAAELQKELIRAQIDALQAQTRSLQSGNALIKIDGAGLQPHLEAFMWEILKTIQVRVNRDGLKLLLGCDVLNVLSTVTFDPSGYIELEVTPQTTQGESKRRVNRVATLDGGVVVNDAGFAEGDRTLELNWVQTSATVEAAIDRILQLYQTLRVSVRSGVYLAAIESYKPGEKESRLSLLVTEKLSA